MDETEESGGSRAVYHNANQLADGAGSRLFNVVDPDRKHGGGEFCPPGQAKKGNCWVAALKAPSYELTPRS